MISRSFPSQQMGRSNHTDDHMVVIGRRIRSSFWQYCVNHIPLYSLYTQWIGLRENLQEPPIFNGKNHGFLQIFPYQSIDLLDDIHITSPYLDPNSMAWINSIEPLNQPLGCNDLRSARAELTQGVLEKLQQAENAMDTGGGMTLGMSLRCAKHTNHGN